MLIRNNGRFIPTHVGNTIYLLSDFVSLTVHPHACGEHLVIQKCPLSHDGSSPRMWGTLLYYERRVID